MTRLAALIALGALLLPAQEANKGIRELKNRYITVKAKCKAADEAYEEIRKSTAESGRVPHPRITTAHSRMKIALDAAHSELDEGKFDDARESLNIAEASATTVLRAAGGG